MTDHPYDLDPIIEGLGLRIGQLEFALQVERAKVIYAYDQIAQLTDRLNEPLRIPMDVPGGGDVDQGPSADPSESDVEAVRLDIANL